MLQGEVGRKWEFILYFFPSILNSCDASSQSTQRFTLDTTVPPRGQQAIVLPASKRPGLKLIIPIP